LSASAAAKRSLDFYERDMTNASRLWQTVSPMNIG
jgi:hypothetical protein